MDIVLFIAYSNVNQFHKSVAIWTCDRISMICTIVSATPVRKENPLWATFLFEKKMQINKVLWQYCGMPHNPSVLHNFEFFHQGHGFPSLENQPHKNMSRRLCIRVQHLLLCSFIHIQRKPGVVLHPGYRSSRISFSTPCISLSR